MNRALRLAIALAALLLAVLLLVPALLGPLAERRLRATAAQHGWVARWQRLRVSLGGRLDLQGLTVTSRAAGDTLFRADSLSVRLDRVALLGLHTRVASLGAARAAVRLPRRSAADVDTLEPLPDRRDS